jgi:hypothetical protein
MGLLDAYVTAEVPNARAFSRAGSVLWKLIEKAGNAGEHKTLKGWILQQRIAY